MKILIIIFFFESKITSGHNFTLMNKQSRLDVESVLFPRGPSMYGIINYQGRVYASSDNVFKDCSRIE